jgi:outer membrane protein OmpA-like peptidoglycan-associated protein
MKILSVVSLVLILAGFPCSSFADNDRFTVFKVEVETIFDQEKKTEPAKDFYITGGTDDGLTKSTILDVYRKKHIIDPTNGDDYEIAIRVGQVRVFKLHKDVAVTRISALTSIDDAPVLRYRTVMVGDYAVVRKTQQKAKKENKVSQADRMKPVIENKVSQADRMKPVMREKSLPADSGLLLPAEVLFKVDDWKLKAAAHTALATVYNTFNEATDKDILIEGHTCSLGAAPYNMELSKKRAQSVSDYLISSFGIPANRIQTKHYGEESPIASNETKAGRKLNRRVVIHFLPRKAESL